MFTREQIIQYRCPRWGDWPNLDLYMDQVVSLMEENLSIFYPDEQAKPITPTMINNYVKQKIVAPSRQKKYGRDHLASFYIIFLLKPVLSLTDIGNGISVLKRINTDSSETYNIFCDEIEAALSSAFGGPSNNNDSITAEIALVRTIAQAFAYALLAKYSIYVENLSLTKTSKENK